MRGLVREDPDDIGAALHLLVQALDRIGAVQLGAVLAGEGHVGQHVVLAGVHAGRPSLGQRGRSWSATWRQVSPACARSGCIEGLPDRGGDDGVLALRDMGEGVAHPVNAAALPGRLEDPGDGGLQACHGHR